MVNIAVIKERIKETIKNSGITQTQLAKLLFVSPSCVAHYVKGDILPSLDKFVELCVITETDPSYLLVLTD